jgi:hypothetical protein
MWIILSPNQINETTPVTCKDFDGSPTFAFNVSSVRQLSHISTPPDSQACHSKVHFGISQLHLRPLYVDTAQPCTQFDLFKTIVGKSFGCSTSFPSRMSNSQNIVCFFQGLRHGGRSLYEWGRNKRNLAWIVECAWKTLAYRRKEGHRVWLRHIGILRLLWFQPGMIVGRWYVTVTCVDRSTASGWQK